MPRLTPLRVLKLLLLPFIVIIGLWLFLPSPTIARIARENHIQKTLQFGHELMTIHKPHSSYAARVPNGRTLAWTFSGAGGLIIPWRLVSHPGSDSVILHVGGHGVTMNLTEALYRAQIQKRATNKFKPWLSGLRPLTVSTGDEDEVIIMPWFNWADSMIISSRLHGLEGQIAMRILVPAPGRVEVWKDVASFSTYPDAPMDLRDSDREFGLLASFDNLSMLKGTRSSITRIKIEGVKGELTSRTWPIRDFIMPVAETVLIIGFYVIIYAGVPVLQVLLAVMLLQAVIVVLRWLIRGRSGDEQRNHDWREEFWLLRWTISKRERGRLPSRTKIWGPSGPVVDDFDGALSKSNMEDSGRWDSKMRSSRVEGSEKSLFSFGFWPLRKKRPQRGRFLLPS